MLDLSGTKVSNEAAIRLQNLLPNCAVIHPAIHTSEADRRVAQWVIDHGGAVRIRRANGTELERLTDKVVPDAPFMVQSVDLNMDPSLTTGLENLAGLRGLKYLNWPEISNADSQFSFLGKFRSLRTINIGHSDASASGVKNLINLELAEELYLNDGKNLSDEAILHLASLKHLLFLKLSGTSITDEALLHLGVLQGLRDLYLDSCPNLTGGGLAHLKALPNLHILSLVETPLTNDAIPHLQKMKNLRILNLTRTKLTADAISRLQAALPDCVIFHESLENEPWQGSPQQSLAVSKGAYQRSAP
tara:strand:- start:50289 stop:51200 length:912 start_codon:yes stop_codon:yes gene_type:complete